MAGGVAAALEKKRKEEEKAAAVASSNVQAALQSKQKQQAAVETGISVSKSFGLGAMEGLVSGILGLPGAIWEGMRESAIDKSRWLGADASRMAKVIPESPLPTPGDISDTIEDVTGLPLDAARAENPVVSAAGQAGGGSVGFGLGLVSKAKQLSTSGPALIRNLAEYAAENPGKFLAAESITGTAGGATGETARQAGAGPGLALAAEVGGSMGAGGGLNIVRGAGNIINRTPRSVNLPDAKTRAAEILQGEASDPAAAAASLRTAETTPGTQHLTADLAEDAGLQSFQKGQILGGDSAVAGRPSPSVRAIEARSGTETALRNEADRTLGGGTVSGQAPVDFVQRAVRQATARIDESIDSARKEVLAQTSSLRGKDAPRREFLNVAARDQFGKVYEAAKAAEKAAWEAVPRSLVADMRPLKDMWAKLAEQRTKIGKSLGGKDLPDDITKAIDDLDSHETVDNLVELRSRILDRARAERAGDRPNARMLKNLGEAQKAILQMIEGAGEAGEGRLTGAGLDALRAARAETRALHEKFHTNTALSRMLGFNDAGGAKVSDQLFLESLVENGPKGGVSIDALMRAVPEEEMTARITEFVERKFSEQALNPDGTVNLAKARRFLSTEGHGPALERLPELRDRLSQVASLAERADGKIKYGTAQRKALTERSTASLFLNAEAPVVVRRVLGSTEPVAEMKRVMSLLKTDETGAAVQGFQRAFLDELLPRMAAGTGERGLREAGLNRVLDQYRPVMRELYTPDQLKRLDLIVKDVQRLGMTRGTQATRGSPTAENLSMLQRIVTRGVGAYAGRAISGTIQIPQMLANLAENIGKEAKGRLVAELVQEAIFDKDLMEALLMRPTPKNTPIILNRLRGHLYNAGVDIDELSKETEEQKARRQSQQQPSVGGLNFLN